MLRRTLLLVVAGAAGLVIPAAGAAPARAATCQHYSATGHDAAASPAGPYIGTLDVTIGEATYNGVRTVTDVTSAFTEAGNSGVLSTTTSHTISLPIGTITTTDKVRLIPTQEPGVYRLVSHLVITGGATGELHLQATLDLNTLTAEGTFVGTICGVS